MATTVYIIGNWAGQRGKETWAYAYEKSKNFASGQIEQPQTTKPLPAGAVEGALFNNTISGSGFGSSRSIEWMIDPRVSWLKGSPPKPDTIVGWATINNASGSPSSKGYEIYPVRASTGAKFEQGNTWYYFSTTDVPRQARESNL